MVHHRFCTNFVSLIQPENCFLSRGVSFLKMGLAATAGGIGIAQAQPVFEPETYDKETDVLKLPKTAVL